MEAVSFLKGSWKHLLCKCQCGLFDVPGLSCIWLRSFHLPPDEPLSTVWLQLHFIFSTLALSSPVIQNFFQFPSSELWRVPFPCLETASPIPFSSLTLTNPAGLNLVITCPRRPSINAPMRPVALLWAHPVLCISSSLQLSFWFVIFSKLKGVSL